MEMLETGSCYAHARLCEHGGEAMTSTGEYPDKLPWRRNANQSEELITKT
jgi:hypothetical protein